MQYPMYCAFEGKKVLLGKGNCDREGIRGKKQLALRYSIGQVRNALRGFKDEVPEYICSCQDQMKGEGSCVLFITMIL